MDLKKVLFFVVLQFSVGAFAQDYMCVGLDGHEDLSQPLLVVQPTNVPKTIGTIKGMKVSFSIQGNETVLVVALDAAGKDLLTVGGSAGVIRFHNYRDGINLDCLPQ